jgi:hypothetical protein
MAACVARALSRGVELIQARIAEIERRLGA